VRRILGLRNDDDGSSFFDLGVDFGDDGVRGADAAAASWVAVDAAGAVHADAVSGHAHPVGERGSDVFIARAAVFAAVTSVDAASFIISGAEDGGALIDDFFGDGVATSWGALSRTPSADWGIDRDGFLRSNEELSALVAEVDADFRIGSGCGSVCGVVLINGRAAAVV